MLQQGFVVDVVVLRVAVRLIPATGGRLRNPKTPRKFVDLSLTGRGCPPKSHQEFTCFLGYEDLHLSTNFGDVQGEHVESELWDFSGTGLDSESGDTPGRDGVPVEGEGQVLAPGSESGDLHVAHERWPFFVKSVLRWSVSLVAGAASAGDDDPHRTFRGVSNSASCTGSGGSGVRGDKSTTLVCRSP